MARAMPGLRWCVDDVALIRDKKWDVANQKLVLPFEHEPRLGSRQMIVATIVGQRRLLCGRIASDDVDDSHVDESARARIAEKLVLIALWLLRAGNRQVVIDERNVGVVV